MTVSTTTTKNSYSANGTLHSFAYGFKIFADADLTVIVRSATGTETTKTLNTHYVVTNAGTDSGGNVLFKFNTGTSSDAHYSTTDHRPASGETVVILRTLTKSQGTDYVENDPFPSTSHEDALDRLTFITQELQEEVDRTIKLSKTNTMTSPEFTTSATDRASKILSFDSSGELSVTQELGTFKGDWAASTAYVIRDIVKDTSTNNIFIVTTAHTSSGSQPLTTNANSAKYSLIVDAASSTTSQTAAANSATAAASSASTASTQASNASSSASTASTQASNASTSASNAASSATAAQNAQAAAETALDTFDDRFLGAKSSDPSVDNDGNALIDGALYFDTTNDIMKVYDLTNTQWRQLTLTSSNQTNVNTVAGAISNVNTVAGANNNITTVASDISDINTVATISSNIQTVAGISSNVTSVAGNSTNINSAVSNATNINTVAGAISNVNAVGSGITNVNTVASNISGVNSFAERYRIASSAPSDSLDVGDLYFDTTANELKVYKSSGWAAAGSTVNGTSARFHYDITSAVTSVTGSDAAGNTLAYDAGFIDVYVNGVRMSTADVTITSGDTVTFASALADGDEVDIVAFGTFAVANIVSTGALNSGSITSGFGNIDTGSSTITTTGAITGGSLVADNITIDGTEIDLSSGDLTLDVAGDIILDADGGDLIFKDGGTEIARFFHASENFQIRSAVSDKDIIFQGNDGGSAGTEIMRIDVSERRLGLGTDSPTEKLSIVDGSGDVAIRIQGNTRSFKIEQNNYGLRISDLDAGGERLRIDAAGIMTVPAQPAFLAQVTSGGQNNFAKTTAQTITFSRERFDQNDDFDTSSYTFTAPVTGRYQLQLNVLLSTLDSAAGYYQTYLQTSNQIYYSTLDPDFGQDNSYMNLNTTVLADMDAGDTAVAKILQSVGTVQTDIDATSIFSGFLAC